MRHHWVEEPDDLCVVPWDERITRDLSKEPATPDEAGKKVKFKKH
jgi:hypothetical protein